MPWHAAKAYGATGPVPAVRLVAVLVGVLAMAGCLEGDVSEPAGDAERDGEGPGRVARGGDRGAGEEGDEVERSNLGQASGGQSLGGRLPFIVTVPPGGATRVEWVLLVTPAAAGLDGIEGPGCQSSGGVTWAVGSYTETRGACSNLAAGDHEFAVVLEQPVLGFSASVTGVVAQRPAGNSTATPSSGATTTA
jgi:hypothetical protein